MVESVSSKRLTLRAALHDVNPMVIRVVKISDQLRLAEFHDIFRTILGWDGDLGYIVRKHGQEFKRLSTAQSVESPGTSATLCTCGSGMFAFCTSSGSTAKRSSTSACNAI